MNQRNNKMESEIREVHVKMSKKIAQLTKGQGYFHTLMELFYLLLCNKKLDNCDSCFFDR